MKRGAGVVVLGGPAAGGGAAGSPEEVAMKVRSSLRSLKNKAGSQIVRREGKILVINRKNPRFNGRQG
jgi:large subunit ribosomal protein L36